MFSVRSCRIWQSHQTDPALDADGDLRSWEAEFSQFASGDVASAYEELEADQARRYEEEMGDDVLGTTDATGFPRLGEYTFGESVSEEKGGGDAFSSIVSFRSFRRVADLFLFFCLIFFLLSRVYSSRFQKTPTPTSPTRTPSPTPTPCPTPSPPSPTKLSLSKQLSNPLPCLAIPSRKLLLGRNLGIRRRRMRRSWLGRELWRRA